MGVTGEPTTDAGATLLYDDGYRFVVPVPTTAADFDSQGHLNNAAVARLLNDMRVAYVHGRVGSWWGEQIRRDGFVVAARELHVLYESEGFPGEEFTGGMRYVRREGKAAVLEQRLVESRTGRALARAWVVQLLVQGGTVVEWPERYFEVVAEIEGHTIERRPRPARAWGPPE